MYFLSLALFFFSRSSYQLFLSNHINHLHISRTLTRRRQWHPTPVLLPGKSHGRRNLVGYSPWGRKESDTTERLHFHFHFEGICSENSHPDSFPSTSLPCSLCGQSFSLVSILSFGLLFHKWVNMNTYPYISLFLIHRRMILQHTLLFP